MSFIIHFLVRTSVAPIHLNTVTDKSISRVNLDSLYALLATIATMKLSRSIAPDEIVIAGIIPIPSGQPEPANQIGGS